MGNRSISSVWKSFGAFHGIVIRWKIKPNSSSLLALKSIPGLCILNPNAFSGCYKRNGSLPERPFRLNGGSVFVETSGLVIGMKSNYKFNPMQPDPLLNELKTLFQYVRSASLQYDIDYRWMGSFHVATKEDLASRRVPVVNQKYIGTQSSSMLTSLDWDDFVTLDKQLASGQSTSVESDLMMDAIDAHFSGDFRRSMLYFCMAAEVAVSSKLEIGAMRLPANDPIYKLLSTKWNFSHKLHEHYLYLFKKSLLQDDKDLYDELLKLYQTRNKIVHQGGGIQTALPFDRAGSDKAFDLVIQLFEWLGDKRLGVFKKRGFEWFGNIYE